MSDAALKTFVARFRVVDRINALYAKYQPSQPQQGQPQQRKKTKKTPKRAPKTPTATPTRRSTRKRRKRKRSDSDSDDNDNEEDEEQEETKLNGASGAVARLSQEDVELRMDAADSELLHELKLERDELEEKLRALHVIGDGGHGEDGHDSKRRRRNGPLVDPNLKRFVAEHGRKLEERDRVMETILELAGQGKERQAYGLLRALSRGNLFVDRGVPMDC